MFLSAARLILLNHYPGYVTPKSKRKVEKERIKKEGKKEGERRARESPYRKIGMQTEREEEGRKRGLAGK